MFELPSFSLEKLLQMILENFESKVSWSVAKKCETIRYLAQIEDARRTKYESCRITEKLGALTGHRRNIDLLDQRPIVGSTEGRTELLGARSIAAEYLRNRNKKILEKVFKSEPVRWLDADVWRDASKRNASYVSLLKENHRFHRSKGSAKKMEQREVKRDRLGRKRVHFKCIPRGGISNYAKRELASAEQFFSLYSKEVEFMMKNVHAALHISIKVLYNFCLRRIAFQPEHWSTDRVKDLVCSLTVYKGILCTTIVFFYFSCHLTEQ